MVGMSTPEIAVVTEVVTGEVLAGDFTSSCKCESIIYGITRMHRLSSSVDVEWNN